jgi:hypothetical protein
MSGWGPVVGGDRPEYNVDEPSPEALRRTATRLETALEALMEAVKLDASEEVVEQMRVSMEELATDADQLHAWAEQLERGDYRWVRRD